MSHLPSPAEINRIMRAIVNSLPTDQRPAPRQSSLPPIPPSVGRKVWFRPNNTYMPHPQGPLVIDSEQAMDATIVFVHGIDRVNLLVSDHLGDQSTLKNITLRQPGCDTPTGHYCEWMPYQLAKAAATPQMTQAVGTIEGEEAGVGACAGCGLCMNAGLASSLDAGIASIMVGIIMDEIAKDPADQATTDTLLKTTLTAAHAAILDGDLTMAGQLVDAALGHIERTA